MKAIKKIALGLLVIVSFPIWVPICALLVSCYLIYLMGEDVLEWLER